MPPRPVAGAGFSIGGDCLLDAQPSNTTFAGGSVMRTVVPETVTMVSKCVKWRSKES
jgi:hypothetical protein